LYALTDFVALFCLLPLCHQNCQLSTKINHNCHGIDFRSWYIIISRFL